MRQIQTSFRHTDKLHSLRGRSGCLQRRRVRHSNVFAGVNDKTTGDKTRVFTGHNHARQVMQGRIHVGTANGLNKSTSDVVMLVTIPVVADHGAIDVIPDGGNIQLTTIDDRLGCGLQVCQRPARIPACKENELVKGLISDGDAVV